MGGSDCLSCHWNIRKRIKKKWSHAVTNSNRASSTDVISADLRVRQRDLYPSKWCTSLGKRIFDVVVATMLLIAALPLMLLASLAVLTSRGPVFFGSERVGQGSKRIRVLKFRTMFDRKELGAQLTRRGDDRVTKGGRILRAWKIDELPQFINVVRGDMSLVGPRPDAAEFLDTLPASVRSALASIKPGITSMATIMFRNEEALLSRVPERELTSYYVTSLLPEKVWLDLEYACQATMFTDVKLLLQTLLAVLR
jgi:lipopolysaccharide/colanic/teichoic acid biosynthesis glycosyltransferase